MKRIGLALPVFLGTSISKLVNGALIYFNHVSLLVDLLCFGTWAMMLIYWRNKFLLHFGSTIIAISMAWATLSQMGQCTCAKLCCLFLLSTFLLLTFLLWLPLRSWRSSCAEGSFRGSCHVSSCVPSPLLLLPISLVLFTQNIVHTFTRDTKFNI